MLLDSLSKSVFLHAHMYIHTYVDRYKFCSLFVYKKMKLYKTIYKWLLLWKKWGNGNLENSYTINARTIHHSHFLPMFFHCIEQWLEAFLFFITAIVWS